MKQGNTVPNKENNQSINIVQELIQMLELAEKDTKAVTAVVHILLRDIKNIEKTISSYMTYMFLYVLMTYVFLYVLI